MEKGKIFAALLLCSSLCALSGQSAARGLAIREIKGNEGKRWAICIGINDYYDDKISKLKKARNDAKALGAVLKDNGQFDYVFVMTDDLEPRDPLFPNKFNIEQKVRSVVEFAGEKDLVVFSFSGHGISDTKGEGYLVGVDSRIDDKFATSVRVSDIVARLSKQKIAKTLLLLDACREEMQEGKGLSNEGLREARYENAEVAATFYATKSGMFSYEDKESDYGVFSRFVVEGLLGKADGNGDKVVTFNELEAFVQDRVTDWSINNGRSQKPYTRIYGERYGDLALSSYDRIRAAPQIAGLAGKGAAAIPEAAAAPARKAWEALQIPGKPTGEQGTLVGGKVYYVGGVLVENGKVDWNKSINSFNLETKVYSPVRDLDFAAAGISVAGYGGKVYFSGGMKGLSPIDKFQVFDPASGSVTPLPKLSSGRIGHSMVAAGDKIYFIGGYLGLSNRAIADLEIFDLSKKAWTRGKSMAYRRSSQTAIALEGKIYVFGGANQKSEPLNSIEIYDIASDSWQVSSAVLPVPIGSMGAVAIDGLVYLIGGWLGRDKSGMLLSNKLYAFHPGSSRIVEFKEKAPSPITTAACVEYKGKVLLLGGSDANSKPVSQVLIFDPGATE
jgi:hypothetical protein